MRSFILVSFLALASANKIEKAGKCVVDGGEAASDLLDAALFVWGAKQRCDKPNLAVKCEIDIASAVQSVSSMVGTILKAVDRCGHDFDGDCGRAATRLTKSIAGMSSSYGGIKQKCVSTWQQPAINAPHQWAHGGWALCVLDIKNTAKNFLKAVKSLLSIEDKCDHGGRKCAANGLKVAGALAGLGEYLAASIGDCETPSNMAHDAECAQEAIMLTHHLMKVSEAGLEISKECKEKKKHTDTVIIYKEMPPARLYEDGKKKDEGATNSASIILGAFLPLTAIVGFVGGQYYASRPSGQSREVISDHE